MFMDMFEQTVGVTQVNTEATQAFRRQISAEAKTIGRLSAVQVRIYKMSLRTDQTRVPCGSILL